MWVIRKSRAIATSCPVASAIAVIRASESADPQLGPSPARGRVPSSRSAGRSPPSSLVSGGPLSWTRITWLWKPQLGCSGELVCAVPCPIVQPHCAYQLARAGFGDRFAERPLTVCGGQLAGAATRRPRIGDLAARNRRRRGAGRASARWLNSCACEQGTLAGIGEKEPARGAHRRRPRFGAGWSPRSYGGRPGPEPDRPFGPSLHPPAQPPAFPGHGGLAGESPRRGAQSGWLLSSRWFASIAESAKVASACCWAAPSSRATSTEEGRTAAVNPSVFQLPPAASGGQTWGRG